MAPPPQPDHQAPSSAEPEAFVVFPWGEYPLQDGDTLNLGRDPDFSPIAHDLAEYDCVSRAHAVIALSRGAFYLRDEGSTNGTTVDGEAIGIGARRVSPDATITLAGSIDISLRVP